MLVTVFRTPTEKLQQLAAYVVFIFWLTHHPLYPLPLVVLPNPLPTD